MLLEGCRAFKYVSPSLENTRKMKTGAGAIG